MSGAWIGTKTFVPNSSDPNYALQEGTTNKIWSEAPSETLTDWSKWTHWNNSSYWYTSTQYDDPVMGKVFSGKAKANTYIFLYYPFSYVSGSKYTLSMYIRAPYPSAASSSTMYGYINNSVGGQHDVARVGVFSTIDNTWRRVVFTLTSSENVTGTGGIGFSISVPDGTILEVAMPQLENKDHVTPFTSTIREDSSNSKYNFDDINRQNSNIQYLSDTLNSLGYTINLPKPVKGTYGILDFPKVSDVNNMRSNLLALISSFYTVTAPALVVDASRKQSFDYIKANAIEQNCQALYDTIALATQSFKKSGNYKSGQSIPI